MSEVREHPPRLIEVDLPIRRISAHARREKDLRHGHISALHMWWARRPLAACRAVICAALWPDPAHELCPTQFRKVAQDLMLSWATMNASLASASSQTRLIAIQNTPDKIQSGSVLRDVLLDFIADFADWDNSHSSAYLTTARALTQAAHEALGGAPGTRPLVVDPFAGGGAIPLEALRVGADAFASDLNPLPVLLNKVVLDYVPRFGERLADAFQEWGGVLLSRIRLALEPYYPPDEDGTTPVAYLWARTLQCEGPGCGVEIPLLNQRLISKRRHVGVELINTEHGVDIVVRNDLPASAFGPGTVTNGKITCPHCGYTMPSERYRARARQGELGVRHYCTVLADASGARKYRNPNARDARGLELAAAALQERKAHAATSALSTVPTEPLSTTEPRRLNVLHYGYENWGALFTTRQTLALTIAGEILQDTFADILKEYADPMLAEAVTTTLGLSLSNILQYNCGMSTWLSDGMISVFIQSSSIPMRADFAEANPLMARLVGGLAYQLERTEEVLRTAAPGADHAGSAMQSSATVQALPDASVAALVTDPPYYFAIPYAELSDFFYVWLRRFLGPIHRDLLSAEVTPKAMEAIQNLPHSQAVGQKDRQHFEDRIAESLLVARHEVGHAGIGIIVFAHASTEGWETLLSALLRAGWVITGSWPIDTEKPGRMLASRQRALASSIHLVCRPRQNRKGLVGDAEVGDWRQVLAELPERIHQWMPRLAEEGVVGADAIFACLGPALEIYSRFSRVEKANGELAPLKEYLEHVWAAVAQEALSTVLRDADASGLEPDARLAVIWLWTLRRDDEAEVESAPAEEDADIEPDSSVARSAVGYVLEFDAARKIAQGLGASLEELTHVVEVKGERARLLSVGERARYLFGNVERTATVRKGVKKRQLSLFAEIEEAAESQGWGEVGAPRAATTTLDRVHQGMLLFGAGRGDALKRFLVDDSVGRQPQFWSLAQALSYLYPAGSEEKRWIDGVLARKKGLGFG